MTNDAQSLPTLPPALSALVEAPTMTGVDLLAQASRMQIARHVALLYAHHDDVLNGDDHHAVHQMRVATRRMRAVLGVSAEVFKPKVIKPLAKRLRSLAGLLGVVRDGDVLLERLYAYNATLEPDIQAAFTSFVATVRAERDAGQAAVQQALEAKSYRKLLGELTDFLAAPLQKVLAPDDSLPILVRHRAGSALWSRYEAVRRYETVLPTATSEQLHDLRIASKHLRYTLELFETPLGTAGQTLIKTVKAAQEHLGLIHDADVAIARAQLFLHKQGTVPTVIRYIDVREAERAQAVADLQQFWTQLTSDTFRKAAGRALAGL